MDRPKFDIVPVTEWKAPEKIEGLDPRIITMPNVPKPIQGPGCQPRTILKGTWDHMRRKCYFDAGYKCEACGAEVGKDIDKRNLHAHELFDYDFVNGVATFKRCVALCETCVDEETEVLTSDGWKKIPQVSKEDKVACWSKDGSVVFDNPTATIETEPSSAIKISGRGAELYFSEDHRLPLRVANKQSPTYGEIKDILAKDYKASHYYNWVIGGMNKKKNRLTAEERVYIAIEADGSMAYDKENPPHGERQRAYGSRYGSEGYRYTYAIRLLKTRKIERLKMLLEESGVKYSIVKETSDNYCEFKVWSNKNLKQFSDCFELDMGAEKAQEFIEELVFWDGTYAQGITTWYTNKPGEVDFVQGVAAQCGIRTSVQVVNRLGNLRKGQWKTPCERLTYSVNFRSVTPELSGKTMKAEKIKWDKKMYCISVPTTYFIARRDGLVFVTGNCHVRGVHSGRMYTMYKKGNPFMTRNMVLEGAEHAFSLIHKWNVEHPGEEPLRLYATWIEFAKDKVIGEEICDLINKYDVKFYGIDGKKQAQWGDWKVVIGNKEYPTPYEDEQAWAAKMEELNHTQTTDSRNYKDPFTGGVFDEIKKVLKNP